MGIHNKFMYCYKGAWIYKITLPQGQIVYGAKDCTGWITEAATEEKLKEKVEIIHNDRGNRAFKSGII